MKNGWMARFGNLLIDGCGQVSDCPEFSGMVLIGVLNAPPDGVSGWGTLRTGDITYAERDGTKFGRDYYDIRQITLTLTIAGEDCCGEAQDPRWAVKQLLGAWRRQCADVPLILYPPGCDCCCDPDDPTSPRPVQAVGRPRVANVQWLATREPVAEVTLRFDANRVMELTNCCGTPNSGEQCVDLERGLQIKTRCYGECCPETVTREDGTTYRVDSCYRCYSHEPPGEDPFQEQVIVDGNECVCPTITATGLLTNPRWTNRQSGGTVQWKGSLPEGATLIINPCDGTATMMGLNVSRGLTITGDLRMRPGELSDWLFVSFGPTDTGVSTVCWKPGTVSI